MAGTPKSWRAKALPRVIRVGGALGRPKAQRVSNFHATDNAWQQCVAEGGSSPSFAPSASLRRISSTVIRVPRITGFPIIIAGLISIRSVVITILLAHHIAPAPVGLDEQLFDDAAHESDSGLSIPVLEEHRRTD